MNGDTQELLGEIGRQLDRHVFPKVKNGGFVMPGQSTDSLNRPGEEHYYEPERQRRPATDSRPGAVGRQGTPGEPWGAGRPRPSSGPPPVVGTDESAVYRESLSSVCEAYPGARIWWQDGGFWLFAESSLLPGLGRKAGFLVGVSSERKEVRSWAFWYSEIAGATWIGPRHTNFPDGSICAYEPRDGTWAFGDPLVTLLDLYSVWALRHLHYEAFGRWPGPQAVSQPYERMLELNDDEHCGCLSSEGRRYVDCCKTEDLQRNRIAEAMKFGFFSCWSLRFPPTPVLRFVRDWNQPPSLAELV